MKRRPIVAANWKMNGTLDKASVLVQSLIPLIKPSLNHVDVVVCPPFTALGAARDWLKGSGVALGAQNAHFEPSGAFTGEVSVPMLKELCCGWVILGHSERRQHFLESDTLIQKKVQAVLKNNLSVILCVGESLDQRKAEKTWAVVESQLTAGLEGLEQAVAAQRLVIAYEPIWAIGTGLNATAAQAQEVHGAIRSWLGKRFDAATADAARIQYGGSVKPDNAQELMSEPDVDGALVGGASLDAKSFASIVEAAERSKCSTV